MVGFQPMTSHPQVEDKDGASVIRGSFHAAMLATQLDDGTMEIEWGLHINFGGKLPKVIVNGFLIPAFDRVLSRYQAYFAYSLKASDLTKSDGKLLGELLVNQIKKARKKGGWKKPPLATCATSHLKLVEAVPSSVVQIYALLVAK
ncbi:hypothetical protein TrLO_g12258 [Triparma laevis f. longispina]|uniref:Uncharacterized protein n=1 Tax=Triparma laevis f. longispina TaxID=1714387 RepID=A0A9W7KU51_9STRA|nr:hypothetical protein TrLO_g12258 [Triparma laevis f. longispina]